MIFLNDGGAHDTFTITATDAYYLAPNQPANMGEPVDDGTG
jgi:hypothetical protein